MNQKLDRVNRIIRHPEFREFLKELEELEKDRIFCGHDMEHLLSVARLAYIESLEKNMHISKEYIYAAALVHDMGRVVQYKTGIDHHIAGIEIAERVLRDCGFSGQDLDEIMKAVSAHGDEAVKEEESFRGILYRADKGSRICCMCKALEECNWEEDKLNMILSY